MWLSSGRVGCHQSPDISDEPLVIGLGGWAEIWIGGSISSPEGLVGRTDGPGIVVVVVHGDLFQSDSICLASRRLASVMDEGVSNLPREKPESTSRCLLAPFFINSLAIQWHMYM